MHVHYCCVHFVYVQYIVLIPSPPLSLFIPQWATSCSSQQFASQSFQLCRALNVPLSTMMLREVLPRLAESVSDSSDELKNYVIEIMLSLENALNNSKEESLHPSGYLPEGHGRQISDITPLPG